MARKSPRSRRKSPAESRLPGTGRARAKPGQRPKRKRRAAGHAPKGARPARKRATRRTPAAPAKRPRRTRFVPPEPARVSAILDRLDRLYPEARCELDFGSPLQLLVATILSAQCTDQRVNQVTPVLFARFPDAAALASADSTELEALVRSTGFYRMKAKSIRAACSDIVTKHGGEVPRAMDALVALRGVGRKTANVVLGNAYGIPGLVVDTHVGRLSNRLGLTNEHDAVKIEFALQPIVPESKWTVFSHWLILHGRRVCNARKPACSRCAIAAHCPRLGVTTSA